MQQPGFGAGGLPAQGFGGQPQGFAGMPPQGLGAMPQGSGLPGSPLGGLGMQQPAGQVGGTQAAGIPQQPMGVAMEAPEDMACAAGPHAAAWAMAKQRFRAATASPLGMAPREVLAQALEATMQDLKAANALSPGTEDECGLGKLCLQLLSIVSLEDPSPLAQLFSSIEQMASPVLTLLLDVPWAATAQAGWPLFGLLAQINARKAQLPGINTDAIDGMSDPSTQAFAAELQAALGKDGAALEAAAKGYLQKDPASGSVTAPMTAMAAQAAGTPQLSERAQMLGALQGGLKQAIGDAVELDIAMSTKWPLWGLLAVGVDSLASDQ
jgi:hypothetical protein